MFFLLFKIAKDNVDRKERNENNFKNLQTWDRSNNTFLWHK